MAKGETEPAAPSRRGGLSYRTRLVLGVCGLVLLTGAAVTWLAHRSAAPAPRPWPIRSSARSAATPSRTRAASSSAPPAGRVAAAAWPTTGSALDDSDRLARPAARRSSKANPGLSWVSYGDEAGTFTGVYRPLEGGLRINQSRIVDGQTRLVEHDVLARRLVAALPAATTTAATTRAPGRSTARRRRQGRLVWLPPYVFYNQGVPGISCAAPCSTTPAELRGVLSIDFDLNALSDFVAGLSVSEHSKVFLFTADEILLAHPDQHMLASSGQAGAGQLPHPGRHRRPAGGRLPPRASAPSTSSPAARRHVPPLRVPPRRHRVPRLGDGVPRRRRPGLGRRRGRAEGRLPRRRLAEPGAGAGRRRRRRCWSRCCWPALLARSGLGAGAGADRLHEPRRRRRPGRQGRPRRQPRVPPAVRRPQPDDRRPARPAAAAALAERGDGGAAAAAAAAAAAGPRPRRRRPQHLLRRDGRRLLRLPHPGRGLARQRCWSRWAT